MFIITTRHGNIDWNIYFLNKTESSLLVAFDQAPLSTYRVTHKGCDFNNNSRTDKLNLAIATVYRLYLRL